MRVVCCLNGMPMRTDTVYSETSAKDALNAFPAERVMHEAAADVEEGLEFWKTIAGKVPSKRRVSREFLNRQG